MAPIKKQKNDDIKEYYSDFRVGNRQKSLQDQLLYQLYKKPVKDSKASAPKIPNDIPPDMITQIDTLYLPDDDGYKYALVAVDVGSRKTDAEPMKKLDNNTVLKALLNIYKRGIVKNPSQTIQVDSGSEFKGTFKTHFEKENINLRVAQAGRHRQQGLVESRNKSIGTSLLKRQTAQELLTGEPSVEWIQYLPAVLKDLNKRLAVKKPWNDEKPDYNVIFAETKCEGQSCNLIPDGTMVRYQLDEPINVQGRKQHGRFRAGDVKWSIKPTVVERVQLMPAEPPMYKIRGKTALYTRNQLQIVNADAKLPPASVQSKYVVEKIIGKTKLKNKVHYEVKWKGYKDTTLESRTDLMKDVPDLIHAFEASLKKK